MMDGTSDAIETAFASDTNLKKRIFDALDKTPQYAPLFADIAAYHLTNRSSAISNSVTNITSEHSSKKRRLDNGLENSAPSRSTERKEILKIRDVSTTLPQRKKFHLSIIQYGTRFHDSSSQFAICATNPSTNQIEFEFPTKDFAYALRVPLPERAQKQYNFCLLPSTNGAGSGSLGDGEGVIWTVNHGPSKSCQVLSPELKEVVGDEDILEKALDAIMQRHGSKLTQPTENEFASATAEAHRKHEKAYHVKAHRGSKDGFLFFLENGIFFGFKKPLAFFPFHGIESVSYTNVLQRTFNLVVTFGATIDADPQEIEFSMLDQADFAGIDGYIRRHHLQDASLAEVRRAKQYKVNGKTAELASGEADDRTELEKAEAELVDEEDEMEEDYEPGSEGDSEGSSASDEENDDDEYDDKAPRDLVEEELGSEAEEVEMTEEEEEEEQEGEEDEADEEEEVALDSSKDNVKAGNKGGEKDLAVSAVSTARPTGRQSQADIQSSYVHHGGPDLDDEDQL